MRASGNPSAASGAVLSEPAYQGRMPSHTGDLAIETHGIAPVPPGNRYGSARRLFTVWFAPQFNLAVVFTGTLAATLGLGFWLGLLAMTIGTVLGALVVAYLSTWGPRTGTAQLASARMAFGPTVAVVAVLQWFSSIAWDALVGLFGGEALAALLGIPFPVAVLLVLVAQGALGVVGYEMIHRIQAVMSAVLIVVFAVLATKLLDGHPIVTVPNSAGADLAGAFVLSITIALSLAVSWASYASDYSRYLPADSRPAAVFGYTFAGLTLASVAMEALGVAAAGVLTDQTAQGVRAAVGGGAAGALAMVVIALGAVTCNAMNDYSGSLCLQAAGVRMRRPESAVLVVGLAFVLILWLRSGNLTARFESLLLFVSYWIPAFVAITAIDWRLRSAGRTVVDPADENTSRADSLAALASFAIAFAAAVPFMNTDFVQGTVAHALHGADLAYFVNFSAAALVYGAYRIWASGLAHRGRHGPLVDELERLRGHAHPTGSAEGMVEHRCHEHNQPNQ